MCASFPEWQPHEESPGYSTRRPNQNTPYHYKGAALLNRQCKTETLLHQYYPPKLKNGIQELNIQKFYYIYVCILN